MHIKRFDVYLTTLDPVLGAEIQKTKPCLVISPDEMNRYISTVIIAPMTTKGHIYPTRVPVRFQNRDGRIVLDQICTIDKSRLVKKLGRIDTQTQDQVVSTLVEMFSR